MFCPSKQVVEPLWPIPSSHPSPSGGDLWPYLGKEVDPRVAAKVADGTLHPCSKQPWSEALLVNGSERAVPRHALTESREPARRAGPKVDNVWNALVYGSEDGEGREEVSRQRDKENHQGERQRPRKHAFCFFPPRRVGDTSEKTEGAKESSGRGGGSQRKDKDSRPPLREIYVGSSNARRSSYVPPPSHKDVPIHFGDYTSRLVGRSFKPISRKRRRNEAEAGTKSSRFVAKLMQNAERHRPSPPPMREEEARKEDVDEEEEEEERQGIEMFQSRSDRRAISHPDEFAACSTYYCEREDAVSNFSLPWQKQAQEPFIDSDANRRLGLLTPAWQTEARSDFLRAATTDEGSIQGGSYSHGEPQFEPSSLHCQEPHNGNIGAYDVLADSRRDYSIFDAGAAHQADDQGSLVAYQTNGQPDFFGDSFCREHQGQTSAYEWEPRPQTGSLSLSNRVSCYSSEDQDTQQLYAFAPFESAFKSRPTRGEREEVTCYNILQTTVKAAKKRSQNTDFFAQEEEDAAAKLGCCETRRDVLMFPTWS